MNITEKSVARLMWSAIVPKVRRTLADRGIIVKSIEPLDDETDCEIKLTGEYSGVVLQIGNGYVTTYTRKGDAFWFIDVEGKRDLLKALTETLAIARNPHAE